MDAAEPTAVASVVVLDTRPARVRRPLDLVRLGGLGLVLLLLAGFGSVGTDTLRGANDDLVRLLADVPHVFIRIFSVLGTFGALAMPLGLIVREIVRGQTRRLGEALVTGLIALGAIEGLDRLVAAFPDGALYHALIRTGSHADIRPFDAYLAALFAFIAVIELSGDPLGRSLLATTTAFYILSAFTATQASLLSLIMSPIIGVLVGIAVRYIAGNANEWPDGARIAAELARGGIDLVRLERIQDDQDDRRAYIGTVADGAALTIEAFDRDLIASGAVHSVSRLIRIRSEIAPSPALSLERATERRTLLTLAARAVDVPVPRLVAGVPCGPDTIVLVYERLPATPMVKPTPAELDELWQVVTRLHRHRVTHRGLTAGRILIDAAGHVLLPTPAEGTVFASDLRIGLDRVQLLITTAQLVGAERAVDGARSVLTDDELMATLPLLQPIALARESRRAVRRDARLLETVREQIQGQTDLRVAELTRVERVRPRTILTTVALIVAGYLLVGQLGTVNLGTVLSSARWQWVPFVVLASVATYFAAALSLMGYVQEKLPFPRTVLVQLAASFAGFVTPPAVGGLAVNIRYLRKARVSITGAATSVGMSQVVNAISHVVLLIAFAAATGASAEHSFPIPGWAFLALGAVAGLSLLLLALPASRRWFGSRLLPPLREALPRLLNLLTSPSKLSESVGGALLLNLAYIAALWFAVRAFEGHIGFAEVAVVYLAGAAIGSVAPTPGGLGAVEVAMSTGLAAVGMPSAAAISSVLLFRLATFWLPVPAGWVALHFLQRRNAL